MKWKRNGSEKSKLILKKENLTRRLINTEFDNKPLFRWNLTLTIRVIDDVYSGSELFPSDFFSSSLTLSDKVFWDSRQTAADGITINAQRFIINVIEFKRM